MIAGKYALLRRLGHGGMAEVFLAKQESEGGFEKLVVLKRILPHLATSKEFLAMFLDEARLASDLRHPNIVTIVDVGRTADTYFMVMEFLHGQDVRKIQRKVAALGQQVPIAHASQIGIDSAAGLHYAHTKKDLQGRPLDIVHRDVSPQNILVTYEGGTKIVDFGIAKAASQSTRTSAGVLKGKYTYMSPEQASGAPVDNKTDQFALGVVLWELFTMRRLFKRENEMQTLEAVMSAQIPRPRRFREDLPASIEDVVMTALAKDRRARFADSQELALQLEDALAKEGIVHSQSRLAQYMRRLFADTLAEEAIFGVVNPDGSLSKNTFPIAGMPEPAHQATPDKKPAGLTQADRKGGARNVPSVPTRAGDQDPAANVWPPSDLPTRKEEPDHDHSRDRNLARSRDRAIAQHRDRGVDRRVLVIAGSALAVLCVVGIGTCAVVRAARSAPTTVIVRSDPRGAALFWDGVDTGQKTPALLKGIVPGDAHKIRLELDGHDPMEEIVTVERRGETAQEIKLVLTPLRPKRER